MRNLTRRGWLLKVYNDKKLLTTRIKTAEYIENDEIDFLQPVGLNAHPKPGKKTEIFTMDVGADSSRRVVTHIIGDREYHPKPDPEEVYMYAPGDKKIYTRMKKKKEEGGQEEGDEGRSQQTKRRTIDRGHEPGHHTDAKDQRATLKTEASYGNEADKGQGFKTKDGNYTIDAGKNTQFQASKHVRKGETMRDGQMYVKGVVHASDHWAGGSAQVQPQSRAAPFAAFARNPSGGGGGAGGDDDDKEPERPKEDGTQEWQAQGKEGNTSLLQTAQKVGTMGGAMGMMGKMMGMISKMMQQGGGGSQEQQEELQQAVQELEDKIEELEAIPDLPEDLEL